MDVVKKCTKAWVSATSDTEKFAALLLIAKLANDSKLSEAQSIEILECIGFSFLSRLLQTEEVLEGTGSSVMYRSCAVSVLSRFSRIQEFAASDEMCSLTAEFRNILNADCLRSNEYLITDTLNCIYGISTTKKGRLQLLENNIVPCLVDIYVNDSYGKIRALDILKVMTYYLKSRIWENSASKFDVLISKISKELNDSPNAEICRTIVHILENHPLCKVQGNEAWTLEVKVTLTNVMRCRVIKELRDLAIKSSSLMLEKCGTFWLEDGTENSKVFFLVLIQLVCVEVQVVITDRPVEAIMKDSYVLTACFSVLEIIAIHMSSGMLWSCVHEHSIALLASVRAAYKAIIEFLLKVSTQWNCLGDLIEFPTKLLTYACVRALCATLTAETGNVDESVHEALPFIISLCSESLVAIQHEEQSCIPAEDVDLMKFFISPLHYLTSDESSCAILVEHGLPNLLFKYIHYQWLMYQKNPSETETLCSALCGIILTLVEKFSFVSASEVLTFCRFLFRATSSLPTDFAGLELKANFCAVGLLLLKRHCCEIIFKREHCFHMFVCFCVKFLLGAHSIESHSTEFVLVEEYHHLWCDIGELWHLGMQGLEHLLTVEQWISSFLMEGSWPQHIVTSLARAENSIEESIKSDYQTLLVSLIRVNSDVIPELKYCGAIAACRRHELRELEALLQE